MLAIDSAVFHWLNQLAGRSCAFDAVVEGILERPVIKAVPLLVLIWWILNSHERFPAERRHDVLGALVLGPVAFFFARLLTLVLPFRERPIADAAAQVQLACGFTPGEIETWSSFPSDHAILYVMLATAIGFASRRLGYAALAYVTAFVVLPRVYVGLHWPSDVVAGAVVGMACAHLARTRRVRASVARWSDALRTAYPGAFHAALFAYGFLVATHFADVRVLARAVLAPLRARAEVQQHAPDQARRRALEVMPAVGTVPASRAGE